MSALFYVGAFVEPKLRGELSYETTERAVLADSDGLRHPYMSDNGCLSFAMKEENKNQRDESLDLIVNSLVTDSHCF